MYKYVFESLLSVLLGINSEVELLDYMAILRLIFGGITILFSTVAVPLYISTCSAKGFQFLHILANMPILIIL